MEKCETLINKYEKELMRLIPTLDHKTPFRINNKEQCIEIGKYLEKLSNEITYESEENKRNPTVSPKSAEESRSLAMS